MEVRKENEKFEKRIVNKRFVIVIIMINLQRKWLIKIKFCIVIFGFEDMLNVFYCVLERFRFFLFILYELNK